MLEHVWDTERSVLTLPLSHWANRAAIGWVAPLRALRMCVHESHSRTGGRCGAACHLQEEARQLRCCRYETTYSIRRPCLTSLTVGNSFVSLQSTGYRELATEVWDALLFQGTLVCLGGICHSAQTRIYLSIYLSICLFIYLWDSVYLSICLYPWMLSTFSCSPPINLSI